MSTTLKALETIALERGRVGAGDIFRLGNKTAATQLVAAGLAEEVTADESAKSLDSQELTAKIGMKLKPEKEEKDDKSTKEDKTDLKTKAE